MLDISTRQVIAFGSSAGGFGSLKLAAELGNATSVAINPQINALRYNEKAVTLLLEICYGGVKSVDLSPELRRKFSAVEALNNSPEVRCLVVQNRLDSHHYVDHFMGFCDAFGVSQSGGTNADGRIITRVYESPDGHGPLPKNMVDEIISSAVKLSEFSANISDIKP